MIPTTRRRTAVAMTFPLLISLLTGGCNSPPGESDDFAREVVRRQAAQQDVLLQQTTNISRASQQLVTADATARHDLAEMQSHLQQQFEAERRRIDAQRDQLESERRDIAGQRHRDPLIAAAIQQAVTLLIAALPFGLVLLLMRAAQNEPADVPLAELLVHEFAAETPRLLPAPPNISPPTHPNKSLSHPAACLNVPDAEVAVDDAEPDLPMEDGST